MLRVTTISNAASAESYYSQADYYLDEEAVPARWHGQAAVLLGLQGDVAFEHFASLCRNQHPFTGQRVTEAMRANRRVGFDMTFSVSKSLSVMHSLVGDDRILRAFRESVHETMQLVEADAAVRVRKDGKNEDRQTNNLVYADFVHQLSRPSAESSTPSPHLHAHVVVLNQSFDPVEGVWKAIQAATLKTNAPYYQAAFRASLAQKIQDLGYRITVSSNDFEITGVSPNVIRAFSPRTEEINRLAKQLGITRPETKAKLGTTSRKAKNWHLNWDQLKNDWLARITHADIQTLYRTYETAIASPSRYTLNPNKPFHFALEHSLERQSVVTERN
ncbi:MAG: relaxase domain-containing protein, partial [Planctomycetaceae bacterium]|nr:relaxase domain-containing protein [Planctomycetaceae bacterium]